MNLTSLRMAPLHAWADPGTPSTANDWVATAPVAGVRASTTAPTRAQATAVTQARGAQAAAPTPVPPKAAPLLAYRSTFWAVCAAATGYEAWYDPRARLPVLVGTCVGAIARQTLERDGCQPLLTVCLAVEFGALSNPQLMRPGSLGRQVVQGIAGIYVGVGF